jgi:hypothetical protein
MPVLGMSGTGRAHVENGSVLGTTFEVLLRIEWRAINKNLNAIDRPVTVKAFI